MRYKVKDVADLVGISVRTLHHYDQIGLLKPALTTPAGYRIYTNDNLEKLQQILFFKEIGFPLLEIKKILDNPDFDRKKALLMHKDILIGRKKRIEEIIQTVEKTVNAIEGGLVMEKSDMFGGFDMPEADQKKYAEEARQKYGKEMVDRTLEKTSKYTKEDWKDIRTKQDAIYQKIIRNMDKGPADPEVQEAVDAWRQEITDNYYDCTLDIFRGLGDLYVQDERFTANIDKYKKGLAAFMRDAMHIYCDRNENN